MGKNLDEPSANRDHGSNCVFDDLSLNHFFPNRFMYLAIVIPLTVSSA